MNPPASTPGSWSNWTGSRCVAIAWDLAPSNEAEVCAGITQARAADLPVRAVGHGYSWSEVVGEGTVLIRTDRIRGVCEIDREAGTARISAGTALQDVARDLWSAGVELVTLGGFSGQTLAGAVSTATHGSGAAHGSLSSSARAFRIVDGRGQLVRVDGVREDALRAAQVGLGALGVVTEIEMEIRPASWLRVEDTWHPDFDSDWFLVDDGIRRAVRWHPFGDGAPVGRPFQLREWVPASAGTDAALPSYAALATAGDVRPAPFSVTEHAVPTAAADAVVHTLTRALEQAPHAATGMPLALRVVAPDDAYLSPYSGTRMMTVSAAAPTRTVGSALFRLVHEALVAYAARPHWAKEHLYTAADLAGRYPDLPKFEAVRREFDPDGMFLTPDLRAMIAELHIDGEGGAVTP